MKLRPLTIAAAVIISLALLFISKAHFNGENIWDHSRQSDPSKSVENPGVDDVSSKKHPVQALYASIAADRTSAAASYSIREQITNSTLGVGLKLENRRSHDIH